MADAASTTTKLLADAQIAQQESGQLKDDLDQVLTGALHDLRGPVRRMALALDMGRTDIIPSQVEKMVAIMQELAAYQRAGTQEPNMQTCDLQALVEGVMTSLDTDRITCEALPSAVCDSEIITDVFTHVLSNALTFSEGAVRVHMHHGITISDEGSFLEPGDVATMFEPFKRFSDKAGTGLGLATCRRLMHRLNGKIRAQANPSGLNIVIDWPELHT